MIDIWFNSSIRVIGGQILGELGNKSNNRRAIRMGKRIAFIKEPKALMLEKVFMARALMTKRPFILTGKLRLNVFVTPKNMRRDLDCELLPDLLQKAGLIRNDRDIWEKHYQRREPSKDKPLIQWSVTEITE